MYSVQCTCILNKIHAVQSISYGFIYYPLQILTQGRTLALDLSLIVGIEPIAGTFTKRYSSVQITDSPVLCMPWWLLVLLFCTWKSLHPSPKIQIELLKAPSSKPSGPSVLEKASFIRLSFRKGGQPEVKLCSNCSRPPVVLFPEATTHAKEWSGDIGTSSLFCKLSNHVTICIDLYWHLSIHVVVYNTKKMLQCLQTLFPPWGWDQKQD